MRGRRRGAKPSGVPGGGVQIGAEAGRARGRDARARRKGAREAGCSQRSQRRTDVASPTVPTVGRDAAFNVRRRKRQVGRLRRQGEWFGGGLGGCQGARDGADGAIRRTYARRRGIQSRWRTPPRSARKSAPSFPLLYNLSRRLLVHFLLFFSYPSPTDIAIPRHRPARL